MFKGVAGSSILTESAPDPEKLDCVMETSGTVLYVSGGVTTCLMQVSSSIVRRTYRFMLWMVEPDVFIRSC